jgi:hypothetical protein
LVDVSTNGAAFAIAQAKSQLGLDADAAVLTSNTDQNLS